MWMTPRFLGREMNSATCSATLSHVRPWELAERMFTQTRTCTYACTRSVIWAAEYHLRNHILCLSVGRRNLTPPSPYMKTPQSSLIWARISTFNMHKGTAKVIAGAQEEEERHKFLQMNKNDGTWTHSNNAPSVIVKIESWWEICTYTTLVN